MMEIIVEGNGRKTFTPNEVRLDINFVIKGVSYEDVLQRGSNIVLNFVNNFLLKQGFTKEDMKTKSFVIKEDTKYNEITRSYDFDGYSYNQNATLKFDYNLERMSRMMEDISKLDNPPYCQIKFGINNEKDCKREILALAYEDAEEKARTIALAANKELKQCMKVDFKPFTTSYISNSMMDSEILYGEKARVGAAKAINNIFTPEDIEVKETLYCQWIAE